MKQLSKTESIFFLSGGLLMVVGAGCYAFMWQQQIASIVFYIGALAFASIQIRQKYEGQATTVKRLKKILNVADLLFILSGVLMIENAFGLLKDNLFSGNYNAYLDYIYNKWVLLLLVAAILEIYTMHRISSLLGKEQ